MTGIETSILWSAREHAEQEYPQESCGIVIQTCGHGQQYIACENIHPEPTRAFRIKPDVVWKARAEGPLMVVHSHPGQDVAKASEADIRAQRAMAVPWLIVPVLDGRAGEVGIVQANGGITLDYS